MKALKLKDHGRERSSLLLLCCLASTLAAEAQRTGPPSSIPPTVPPRVIVAPPPPPPPAPVVTPPPAPIITPPPARIDVPVSTVPFFQPLLPVDVTRPSLAGKLPVSQTQIDPLTGIQMLPDEKFPTAKDLKGSSEWILVRGEEGAQFTRPTEFSAKLIQGAILVSVRRPSHIGLVQTPLGDIALDADSDLMIKFDNNVLRVFNITARGTACKAKLGADIYTSKKGSHTVSLAPGFEMVASNERIGRREMRPGDGIARRKSQLLADGKLAINEFSVESVLSSSAIVASIAQKQSDAKEKRILGDMSKMAAVLNYVNGGYGYTVEGNAAVAQKPGGGTQ